MAMWHLQRPGKPPSAYAIFSIHIPNGPVHHCDLSWAVYPTGGGPASPVKSHIGPWSLPHQLCLNRHMPNQITQHASSAVLILPNPCAFTVQLAILPFLPFSFLFPSMAVHNTGFGSRLFPGVVEFHQACYWFVRKLRNTEYWYHWHTPYLTSISNQTDTRSNS